MSIVYLLLPNGDLDKLEMKYRQRGNSKMKYEIYFNDKMIWSEGGVDSGFVIIK
ncbi:hypothetical protein LNQ81_02895 [Myroides sp. M-43]|uniref:hypothetical protein n=1 Tax=Myroides oncorhynchi TaxID=2893756 RepID=UPI001E62E3D9|nr:hypothetical protein [Myroides oncorhynchi]MCC9041650.1 hypothetical protein [Myroides oncorhynchi]